MNRKQPPRRIDAPEPCFVRMKLIRHGRNVGARIYLRLGMLAAEINGKEADPHQVWHAGELIDEAAYLQLMESPLFDPFVPVFLSDAGVAERVKEAAEQDYWMTQPITR